MLIKFYVWTPCNAADCGIKVCLDWRTDHFRCYGFRSAVILGLTFQCWMLFSVSENHTVFPRKITEAMKQGLTLAIQLPWKLTEKWGGGSWNMLENFQLLSVVQLWNVLTYPTKIISVVVASEGGILSRYPPYLRCTCATLWTQIPNVSLHLSYYLFLQYEVVSKIYPWIKQLDFLKINYKCSKLALARLSATNNFTRSGMLSIHFSRPPREEVWAISLRERKTCIKFGHPSPKLLTEPASGMQAPCDVTRVLLYHCKIEEIEMEIFVMSVSCDAISEEEFCCWQRDVYGKQKNKTEYKPRVLFFLSRWLHREREREEISVKITC